MTGVVSAQMRSLVLEVSGIYNALDVGEMDWGSGFGDGVRVLGERAIGGGNDESCFCE